ncbi:MAG: RNA methyltransferase [Saprospiraceae bacterium]|nr:RNA methyltransferase [Saprospiraceae bacterium]
MSAKSPELSEARNNKLKLVANNRQNDLTLILDGLHDPHNIGAILRSCDSVGVREIYVIQQPNSNQALQLRLGKRSSSSAHKWVDTHVYTNVKECVAAVRQKYSTILSTHLSEEAKSLYDCDLAASVALVFGNERDGVSNELQAYVDGNFIIPQVGMVNSLNVSVACAVSLYEAYRQRELNGNYVHTVDELNAVEHPKQDLYEEYTKRAQQRFTGGKR